MSHYPDSMSFRAGPYAAHPRDLTADERATIAKLEAAIALVRKHKIEMASLPDTDTPFGPSGAASYYDDMIRDFQFAISDVESAPDDELLAEAA